ncbi:MAG: pilus assembly protein [Rhizobiaceae bacterium]|nr:pilus assembly protein [Rhizobiaceae bacterium]
MSIRFRKAIVSRGKAFREAPRRFARDERGVSAIEFVLIFPLLVGMLAGTVDIGQALTVSRKMNQVVSTLGDMTSQETAWSSTDIDAIIAGTATIIEPFDKADLKIDLAVLDVDASLDTKVNWARAYNKKSLTKNSASPVAIPTNIAQSGVQLIAVKATYTLTTPFSKLLEPITGVTTYNYQKTYIMRPRNGDAITLE